MASSNDAKYDFVDEEYGVQHHRVVSQDILGEVISTIKHTVHEALEAMWFNLDQQNPEADHDTAHSLMKNKFNDVIDKHSLLILESIQKALAIPSSILLPEDVIQKQQYSEMEIEDLKKSNLELYRKALCNSKLKDILKDEIRNLEVLDVLGTKLTDWEERCKKFRTETEELREKVDKLDSLLKYEIPETSIGTVKRKNCFKKFDLDNIDE